MKTSTLSSEMLCRMDAYWQAVNYIRIGLFLLSIGDRWLCWITPVPSR